MKKLLLSVFGVLALSVCAQAQTWNFSDFEALTYTDNSTVNGLTIVGSSTASIAIDASNKAVDEYSFTKRLKFGGSGAVSVESPYLPTNRYVSFPVTGNVSITVYGVTSSTNATRTLVISDGTNEIGTLESTTADIVKTTVSYTGGAGTIYVYSKASGFNIYLLKAVSGSTGINDVNADKGAIISTDYYSVDGIKVSENATGLLIKKVSYEDGSVEVLKEIVRK